MMYAIEEKEILIKLDVTNTPLHGKEIAYYCNEDDCIFVTIYELNGTFIVSDVSADNVGTLKFFITLEEAVRYYEEENITFTFN